jgi:serine-type D-Ala-D-Ala carboxypeptidase (penicillin-binding protein 5/6)
MTRRIAVIAGLVLAFGATAAVAIAIWPDRTSDSTPTRTETRVPAVAGGGTPEVAGTAPAGPAAGLPAAPPVDPSVDPRLARFALQPVTGALPVHHSFKHPPAAGVLFDVNSGRVLWQRHEQVEHPIASLTKMMTALLVAQEDSLDEQVRVSDKAAHTPGSATGLLPRGHKVPLGPLLEALIMISANDAAVALAEHDAGTVTGFVKRMNEQAQAMGLACTHFTTPNGLRDRGNHSCALDLAALARADLANPRIARIAQTRYAKPHFPIKGNHLYLSNNHYFLQRGLTGIPEARVTGLKTGFTDLAGRCYVTTAEIGKHELGVVILDSPNPLMQVPALLRAGFEAEGVPLPPPPPVPPKQPPEG